MKIVVVGAGRQGVAAAFDVAKHIGPDRLSIADTSREAAATACDRVNTLVGATVAQAVATDAEGGSDLEATLAEHDLAIAAAPYRLNPNVTRAGLSVGCHVVDMGVDTPDALEAQGHTADARSKGVCLVTDCGIAPGTVNVMARWLLDRFPESTRVRLYCGGLPEVANAPFYHKVGFSVDSLLGEYIDPVDELVGGTLVQTEPLAGFESLDFPGIGLLEAMTTSGGTGTAAHDVGGAVTDYGYKTLRYPGHWQAMLTLRDGGFWSQEPVNGAVPYDVTVALMERAMVDPTAKDIVVTRAIVEDGSGLHVLDLIDRADPVTGFSAMQRTTGFSTAVMAQAVVEGRVSPGCHGCERAVDPDWYLSQLAERGIVCAFRDN